MASGLVVHIAAGEQRQTEVFWTDRIRVGSCSDCDLRIGSGGTTPSPESGLLLELARTNGHYRITEFDRNLPLTHNGHPLVLNAKLADGDEIKIDSSSLALQFFPVRALPAVVGTDRDPFVAPFIEQAALETSATVRRDDAKVFLREFTRELVREINFSTKIIVLAIAITLVGGLLYFGFAVQRELNKSSQTIAAQSGQIEQLNKQLSGATKDIKDVEAISKAIQNLVSLAPKLRTEYGGGVCLISGSFIFVEASSGRPLRYPDPGATNGVTEKQAGELPPPLTPEGKGSIAEFEFVGSGFYVGGGFVLTNKHVAAQPWLADERALSLSSSVNGQGRVKRLAAYFPDRAEPIPLKMKQAAQRDDLAACVLDINSPPAGLPALPLDRTSDAVSIGNGVVLMGYPSGPTRLLARLDEGEARSIQTRCGSSLESLLDCLSQRKHIQPLTTQGHITDLDVHRIIYDASTAEGGSGAPLFGQSGRVIGINFAVLADNNASNFAVPISDGIALLERAGWVPQELPAALQPESTNSNQPTPRTLTAPAAASR